MYLPNVKSLLADKSRAKPTTLSMENNIVLFGFLYGQLYWQSWIKPVQGHYILSQNVLLILSFVDNYPSLQ